MEERKTGNCTVCTGILGKQWFLQDISGVVGIVDK